MNEGADALCLLNLPRLKASGMLQHVEAPALVDVTQFKPSLLKKAPERNRRARRMHPPELVDDRPSARGDRLTDVPQNPFLCRAIQPDVAPWRELREFALDGFLQFHSRQ